MIYEVTIAEKVYRVELVRTEQEWKCKLDGRELPLDVVSAQEGWQFDGSFFRYLACQPQDQDGVVRDHRRFLTKPQQCEKEQN
jgi:hypothetical protein